jgi:hypothetical protein
MTKRLNCLLSGSLGATKHVSVVCSYVTSSSFTSGTYTSKDNNLSSPTLLESSIYLLERRVKNDNNKIE